MAKVVPKKKLSVLKRARQAEKRRLRNKAIKTNLKTLVKKALTSIQANKEDKEPLVINAVKKLDKAVSKGIIHKNTAARKKSRLMKKLNQKKVS